MTGFYTNRKTARLRGMIGDDALWLPPRLWAYAAENQPDGDISSYSAQELALLLGYHKDATSMLQALHESGFVDENGMIHDWQEHNGYHEKYSARAKIAAAARWSKQIPPTPPKENKEETGKGKGDTSIATSMLVASRSEVLDAWNALGVVPKCLVLSDKRRRALDLRLKEPFFAENWQAAIAKVKTSNFCQGQSDRGWRASLDWFIQPDVVAKIMEGKYDNHRPQAESKQMKEVIEVRSL